ncbi:hypothetical protein A0H81_05683 [Grifola frondosa]|uniref:Uncharacterized protein n=1 Tax=Grifola frondosa TaxID=5627 RepID=A0A1C7MDB9_GRIFR|nr:hypothetical protein A0H81_05683 [Grifola frondosa]
MSSHPEPITDQTSTARKCHVTDTDLISSGEGSETDDAAVPAMNIGKPSKKAKRPRREAAEPDEVNEEGILKDIEVLDITAIHSQPSCDEL